MVDNISILYLIGSALALTAGLAWNNAIQACIKLYFPYDSDESVIIKFIYAIIITLIIILVMYILNYIDKQVELNKEKALKKLREINITQNLYRYGEI